MRVEAGLYLVFYDILLAKFIEEEYDDPPGEHVLESEIWAFKPKVENQKVIEFTAVSKFDLNSYKYFYSKKATVLNDKPQEIPVNDRSLYKALEYIGIRNSFNENDHQTLSPSVQAKALWNEFKKNHQHDIISSKGKLKGIHTPDVEASFLNYVTSNEDVFKPTVIHKLIEDYFTAIANKKFHDAWVLLSPRCQRSTWEGSYHDFVDSFRLVKSIKLFHFSNVMYSFKRLVCPTTYDQEGILLNVEELFKNIEDRNNNGRLESQDEVSIDLLKRFSIVHQRLLKEKYLPPEIDWRKEKKKIHDFFFQKLLSNRLTRKFTMGYPAQTDISGFSSLLEYEIRCSADIVCVYFEDKWLIEDTSTKPINRSVHKMSSIQNKS